MQRIAAKGLRQSWYTSKRWFCSEKKGVCDIVPHRGLLISLLRMCLRVFKALGVSEAATTTGAPEAPKKRNTYFLAHSLFTWSKKEVVFFLTSPRQLPDFASATSWLLLPKALFLPQDGHHNLYFSSFHLGIIQANFLTTAKKSSLYKGRRFKDRHNCDFLATVQAEEE